MKKISKILMLFTVCTSITLTSGCAMLSTKTSPTKEPVSQETPVYNVVSTHSLNENISIKADLSGSDYILDNDDIKCIDIIYNPSEDVYLVRMPFNHSGIQKFANIKEELADKNLSLTANGKRVFSPPVFGSVKDNVLLIEASDNLDDVQNAVKMMTDYDYFKAVEEGFETIEEYKAFLLEEQKALEEAEKAAEEADGEAEADKNMPDIDDEKSQNEDNDKLLPPSDEPLIYRVRKSPSDAKSQIGAFNMIDNAVRLANQRASEGYKVYDQYGNLIYAP